MRRQSSFQQDTVMVRPVLASTEFALNLHFAWFGFLCVPDVEQDQEGRGVGSPATELAAAVSRFLLNS